MHFSTALLLLRSGLVPLALAQYTIQDDYSGENFFNLMTFDTEDDPTHGYVNYVDQATAQSEGLISTNNGVVTIKSDSTSVASGRGRNSVRVTSTKQYTHGLVVLDLEHMPASACGIWPAFWMTGPSWPNDGEIDIIEGVNYQTQNAMTMHTNAGCTLIQKDCEGNQGCGLQTGGSNSFGDGFNNANGGVYAMEWTSETINIWFFTRSNVPSGISGSSPDPSTWGNPTASFQGGSGCTIDDHFKDNNIVFDTTFCGDWAGSVWSTDPTCSTKAPTCQSYVQNNPSAFTYAYWTINSLKVYTPTGGSTPAAVAIVSHHPSSSQPAATSLPTTQAAPPAAAPKFTTTTSSAPAVVKTVSAASSPASSPASSSPPSPSSSSSSASEDGIYPIPAGYEGPTAVGSLTPGGPEIEHTVPAQDQGDAFQGSPGTSKLKRRELSDLVGRREEEKFKRGRVGRHLRGHALGGMHRS